MSSLPAELMRTPGGFFQDLRFAPMHTPSPCEREPAPEIDLEAAAYEIGFAAGSAQAREAANEAEQEREARRNAIEMAFARFDRNSGNELRERLRQTVLVLCEEAVVPLTVDPDGLAARIDKAVGMLQRSQDERRVLINPEDLALVKGRLPAELTIEGDPTVERGALRVVTEDGGIEDGPSQWRRILAEAFREC